MAASMLQKFCGGTSPWLLTASRLMMIQPVRLNHRKFKRRKFRKPEEETMEWAEPLLEYKRKLDAGEIEKIPIGKVHAVFQTKPLKGRPYWEKDYMEKIGLGKVGSITVQKNTPNANSILKKIQHLVKIVPISFPYGLPEDESDFENCILHEDGRFVVNKLLKSNFPKLADNPVSPEISKWDMTQDLIDRENYHKRINYEIYSEFSKATYNYVRNKGGQEEAYDTDIKTEKELEEYEKRKKMREF